MTTANRFADSTVLIAGVPVASSSPTAAADAVISVSKSVGGSGHDVHLVNAYTLALADREAPYFALLGRASANFPDGKPLSWASRLIGTPIRQVRGPGIFANVFDRGREHDLRHFLLGATPETLAALEAELMRRYPGALVVGAESPPFRPMETAELEQQDARILASGAEVVWVGLGTPKQDFEAARLAASIPVVAVAVGAAFDFVAGNKREAPAWMTRVGVEWLFRFASEPRRLWRRYVFGNARFVAAVLRGSRSR